MTTATPDQARLRAKSFDALSTASRPQAPKFIFDAPRPSSSRRIAMPRATSISEIQNTAARLTAARGRLDGGEPNNAEDGLDNVAREQTDKEAIRELGQFLRTTGPRPSRTEDPHDDRCFSRSPEGTNRRWSIRSLRRGDKRRPIATTPSNDAAVLRTTIGGHSYRAIAVPYAPFDGHRRTSSLQYRMSAFQTPHMPPAHNRAPSVDGRHSSGDIRIPPRGASNRAPSVDGRHSSGDIRIPPRGASNRSPSVDGRHSSGDIQIPPRGASTRSRSRSQLSAKSSKAGDIAAVISRSSSRAEKNSYKVSVSVSTAEPGVRSFMRLMDQWLDDQNQSPSTEQDVQKAPTGPQRPLIHRAKPSAATLAPVSEPGDEDQQSNEALFVTSIIPDSEPEPPALSPSTTAKGTPEVGYGLPFTPPLRSNEPRFKDVSVHHDEDGQDSAGLLSRTPDLGSQKESTAGTRTPGPGDVAEPSGNNLRQQGRRERAGLDESQSPRHSMTSTLASSQQSVSMSENQSQSLMSDTSTATETFTKEITGRGDFTTEDTSVAGDKFSDSKRASLRSTGSASTGGSGTTASLAERRMARRVRVREKLQRDLDATKNANLRIQRPGPTVPAADSPVLGWFPSMGPEGASNPPGKSPLAGTPTGPGEERRGGLMPKPLEEEPSSDLPPCCNSSAQEVTAQIPETVQEVTSPASPSTPKPTKRLTLSPIIVQETKPEAIPTPSLAMSPIMVVASIEPPQSPSLPLSSSSLRPLSLLAIGTAPNVPPRSTLRADTNISLKRYSTPAVPSPLMSPEAATPRMSMHLSRTIKSNSAPPSSTNNSSGSAEHRRKFSQSQLDQETYWLSQHRRETAEEWRTDALRERSRREGNSRLSCYSSQSQTTRGAGDDESDTSEAADKYRSSSLRALNANASHMVAMDQEVGLNHAERRLLRILLPLLESMDATLKDMRKDSSDGGLSSKLVESAKAIVEAGEESADDDSPTAQVDRASELSLALESARALAEHTTALTHAEANIASLTMDSAEEVTTIKEKRSNATALGTESYTLESAKALADTMAAELSRSEETTESTNHEELAADAMAQ
ncbi:hypothetical protein GMORB2_1770 [Geosmithia morbida]|uniref:Uncharacterized protein n=1 Tax=Geosmithia morbida TaxID=1094350 RepID=A0A9P4YTT0_9HYPO|nr:uncharacterized protein GMORB2_1770 [Geosmithia morbida]KAF4121930.1 hypothetical protein GMORB2_1770 [Geosmithia morbida]